MQTDIREFLDKLIDEENWDTMELVNDRGESAYFEQICVIPESDEVCYAILQPVDREGNEVGDILIFVFNDADTDDVTIDVVTDQYKIRDIYDEYRRIRGAQDDSGDDEEDEEDDEDEEEENDGDSNEDIEDDKADI